MAPEPSRLHCRHLEPWPLGASCLVVTYAPKDTYPQPICAFSSYRERQDHTSMSASLPSESLQRGGPFSGDVFLRRLVGPRLPMPCEHIKLKLVARASAHLQDQAISSTWDSASAVAASLRDSNRSNCLHRGLRYFFH